MKRGLFLLATVTLSSALYAQQTLTREAVSDLFTTYNPQLMTQAGQQPLLQQWVEQVIDTYTGRQLPDTLENRYTLIALVRNFENSILLDSITKQYQRALLYARMGDDTVEASARVFAQTVLPRIYARIWAVSVQVKEDLLARYQQQKKQVAFQTALTPAQRQELQAAYQRAITLLRADLKQLRTAPGRQVQALTAQTLAVAQAEIGAAVSSLQAQETSNLQVKTNHKKPVAE